MKLFTLLLPALLLLAACQNRQEISSIDPVNWESRTVTDLPADSLLDSGTTYLAIYSEIYSQSEHRTHDLTVTVSLRNTDEEESIYISRADYFDTGGQLIRTYFERPIYLAPLETVEIIIGKRDQTGGSGANFLFDWQVPAGAAEPLFEAVMISTYGQQGLSFTTSGRRIK